MDQEEFLVELYARGIDTTVSVAQGRYVVEFDDLETKHPLGVASGPSLEAAIAQVFKKLANDSKAYKKSNVRPEGLSIL